MITARKQGYRFPRLRPCSHTQGMVSLVAPPRPHPRAPPASSEYCWPALTCPPSLSSLPSAVQSPFVVNHAPLPAGWCARCSKQSRLLLLSHAPCVQYVLQAISPSKLKLLPSSRLLAHQTTFSPLLRDTQSLSLPRRSPSAFDTRPRFESAVTPLLISNPAHDFPPRPNKPKRFTSQHVCHPRHHHRSARRGRC
jgi:hypothetical protein